MNLKCADLEKHLSSVSLVRACDTVKDHSLRLSTPFRYPNGSFVDVFLECADLVAPYELTDKGQTFDYLSDLQIRPTATKRRKMLLNDICASLGVKHEDGVLKALIPRHQISDISEVLIRLTQACVRVADLAFTHRFRKVGDFHEDVEEYIYSTGLDYDAAISLDGRYGKKVDVDFLVKGNLSKSIIQTITTASPAAHTVVNEIFRKWYDLENLQGTHRRITVYDSSEKELLRSDDLSRLNDCSELIGYPAENERFQELLKY